ncbi:MAG: BrnT family toxin, partial [Candidatus Hydrogenedentes bacterium]|nr:BrnT family toxin [Candidatus Hydrogenedentota bacterium]
MRFEWDETKNRRNIQNHGIDFLDVPEMFQRPMVSFPDERSNYGEDRWIGIGILKSIMAVVVFTERESDTIR